MPRAFADGRAQAGNPSETPEDLAKIPADLPKQSQAQLH